MNKLEIFTDGASRSNPGLAAWGVYVPNSTRFFSDVECATNNQMELTAVLNAFKYVISLDGPEYDEVVIYSDSSYVVNTFNNWVWTWLKSNTLETKKNHELISKILLLRSILKMDGWKISMVKVPGHLDNEGNIEADRLCNYAMDNHGSCEVEIPVKCCAYAISLLSDSIERIYISEKDRYIGIEYTGWSTSKDGNTLRQKLTILESLFSVEINLSGCNTSNSKFDLYYDSNSKNYKMD